MRFSILKMAVSDSRSAGLYRWVLAWLSMSCAIGFGLLGSTIRDYRFVSQLLATQQVRHQMTLTAAQIEQNLRRNDLANDTLEAVLAGTQRGDESIELRSADGVLLQHLGTAFPTSAFTIDEVHDSLAKREPLYRIVSSPAGKLVIEVFPMRRMRRPDVAVQGPLRAESRPVLLEIALPLKDADASVLKPLRQHLTINLAAAISLLATVLLAGVGLRSYARGQRLEEQVEIARQVQSRLLPHSTVQMPGIEIATEYKPAEVVGGDFYDVFTNAADRTSVVLGDVSGKGIPSALLMGVIHGAVRTAPWQNSAASHEEESQKLNRLLCDRASGNNFASMFWCVYDEPLRTLRYVNAGHCPPVLIGKREGRLLTTRLDKGGPVLGLLPYVTYEATTVEISDGDLLVMYSDGLVEAANDAHQEYGDERLIALLHKHVEETPAKLRENILTSLGSFASADVVQDDLTFAIVRFGPDAVRNSFEGTGTTENLPVAF